MTGHIETPHLEHIKIQLLVHPSTCLFVFNIVFTISCVHNSTHLYSCLRSKVTDLMTFKEIDQPMLVLKCCCVQGSCDTRKAHRDKLSIRVLHLTIVPELSACVQQTAGKMFTEHVVPTYYTAKTSWQGIQLMPNQSLMFMSDDIHL